MKLTRSYSAFSLTLLLVFSFLIVAVQDVAAQDSKIALQRGYRTGYSDGYMFGYRDSIENSTKNYSRHGDYATANRAYNKDYGSVEDYRDGYQQGFEKGYDTGFAKSSFDATIPTDLKKRGVIAVTTVVEEKTTKTKVENKPVDANANGDLVAGTETKVTTTTTTQTVEPSDGNDSATTENTVADNSTYDRNSPPTMRNRPPGQRYTGDDDAIIIIPADTELVIELLDGIDTEKSREGDKFRAKVISPYEIDGAIIEGRIAKITRPGRLKRRAELLLSFDRIILDENRWSNYAAILTEVLAAKGDNVKRIDEGTAVGKSSYKDDAIKVGAATGTGLVIGAVAGGPVGAAVGAGVGAAFGVGAVVIERGKDITLKPNQQLRIRTSYETQIR